MRVYTTDKLFPWHRLDDSPDIGVIKQVINAIDDSRLLSMLRADRGRGRNDYPVEVLWYCVLLHHILRHHTIEETLGELRRNEELRYLGKIKSVDGVPKKWNISRFMVKLGRDEYREEMRRIFNEGVKWLGYKYNGFGESVSGDSTHLSAFVGRGEVNSEGLQPDGGRREYVGADGRVEKAFEWFGYKLHILCDSRHEVALAYEVSKASVPDNKVVDKLLRDAVEVLPDNRIKFFMYDKACDDEGVHRVAKELGMKPVIEHRVMWREEFEKVLEGRGVRNIVYDEAGTVYCYDMVSKPCIKHRMAYIGYERDKGTLKYRCPARHEGWRCASEGRCNKGKVYGLTVRVNSEIDLRRFPPIPRATKEFERLYKGRSSVERVIGRLKVFWGMDDGNIAGGYSFLGRVGVVMLVHIGFALVLANANRVEVGTLGKMKLSSVAKSIYGK